MVAIISDWPHRFPRGKLRNTAPQAAFTLIEIMVSMAIALILMGVVFYMISGTTKLWKRSSGKTQAFQDSRAAFEKFTQKLSQATLNTYWDYDYDSDGNPTKYKRQSELHFISGNAVELTGVSSPVRPTQAVFFAAPIGFAGGNYSSMQKLLNACGFYIEFGSDEADRPAFLSSLPIRWRYRLKEFSQPAEQLSIFNFTSGKPEWPVGSAIGNDWFAPFLTGTNPPVRNLAENFIALVILPRLPEKEDFAGTALAPNYSYNSRKSKTYQGKDSSGSVVVGSSGDIKHQLPPLIQVVMVAIDETSAARLAEVNGTSAPALIDPLWFKDAAKLKEDLASLQASLDQQKIDYRVFTSLVTIEGAKWSAD